ncbi:plastid-lipid associated protein PAP / fibrillin family protein isoform X2 [Wolffia australiana]
MAAMAATLVPAMSDRQFFPPRRNLNRVLPSATRSSSSSSAESLRLAKSDLIDLISDQDRGLRTEKNASRRSEIIRSIDALAEFGKEMVTSGPSLSGTWRMLWTTEKEQLFIIRNAFLFGTATGDVLQVIDMEKGLLNNVITFPPSDSPAQFFAETAGRFRFPPLVRVGLNLCTSMKIFGSRRTFEEITWSLTEHRTRGRNEKTEQPNSL